MARKRKSGNDSKILGDYEMKVFRSSRNFRYPFETLKQEESWIGNLSQKKIMENPEISPNKKFKCGERRSEGDILLGNHERQIFSSNEKGQHRSEKSVQVVLDVDSSQMSEMALTAPLNQDRMANLDLVPISSSGFQLKESSMNSEHMEKQKKINIPDSRLLINDNLRTLVTFKGHFIPCDNTDNRFSTSAGDQLFERERNCGQYCFNINLHLDTWNDILRKCYIPVTGPDMLSIYFPISSLMDAVGLQFISYPQFENCQSSDPSDNNETVSPEFQKESSAHRHLSIPTDENTAQIFKFNENEQPKIFMDKRSILVSENKISNDFKFKFKRFSKSSDFKVNDVTSNRSRMTLKRTHSYIEKDKIFFDDESEWSDLDSTSESIQSNDHNDWTDIDDPIAEKSHEYCENQSVRLRNEIHEEDSSSQWTDITDSEEEANANSVSTMNSSEINLDESEGENDDDDEGNHFGMVFKYGSRSLASLTLSINDPIMYIIFMPVFLLLGLISIIFRSGYIIVNIFTQFLHPKEQSTQRYDDTISIRLHPDGEGHEVKDSHMCSICLRSFQADILIVLPCKHVFHKNCIDTWFKLKHSCPVCGDNLSHRS